MNSKRDNILVWDWPVRVGHWLLAGSFILAYVTAESERWRLIHVISGLVVAALVVFRLLWGVVGTRHAQFSQFIRSPAQALSYLKSLMGDKALHFTGHNPAGAIAIMLLLFLSLLSSLTGWAVYNEWGLKSMGEVHEVLSHLALSVVAVHLGGVVIGSIAHKENLVRAMLTGRKRGKATEEIGSARAWALIPLALWVGWVVWAFR